MSRIEAGVFLQRRQAWISTAMENAVAMPARRRCFSGSDYYTQVWLSITCGGYVSVCAWWKIKKATLMCFSKVKTACPLITDMMEVMRQSTPNLVHLLRCVL